MPAVAAQRHSGAAVLAPSKLQEQLNALYRTAPKLCPVVRPKGMDDQGLVALAKREPEGEQVVLQLESVLGTAAQACTCCAFCGQTGEAAVGSAAAGSTDEAIDPATLLFTTNWRLDFNRKSMQLHRAQFACGLCRACMDLSGFIACAAASDHGELAQDRSELMTALCSHLVEVNAPEGIDSGNAVACTAWAQEVYALAYSMRVIASNVRGWRLLDAEGGALNYRTQPGATVAVAQRCLQSSAPKSARKKKKKVAVQVEEEEARPVTPAPVKKKKKVAHGASKTPGPLKSKGTAVKKKKRRGSL
eukprot:CAMPEP_0177760298 /NCGR_PEP_ID=MMETSP0491_2-20121128/5194_1 /TAXON_ID=63592 /ORGANISM="Tetraselmis chuii, Strain PLY429" /LENGTH=303 /DNA_ID=CAMNT_0019276191 /DNA_START=151 /DNA_END=1062 /DNA_ORIENTATION=+